jgi:hypothetical protein
MAKVTFIESTIPTLADTIKAEFSADDVVDLLRPYRKDERGDAEESMRRAAHLLTHIPYSLLNMMRSSETFNIGESAEDGDSCWKLLTIRYGHTSAVQSPLVEIISLLVRACCASYGQPYFVNSCQHLIPVYYKWREMIRTKYTYVDFAERISALTVGDIAESALFPLRDARAYFNLESLWTGRSVDGKTRDRWLFSGRDPRKALPTAE